MRRRDNLIGPIRRSACSRALMLWLAISPLLTRCPSMTGCQKPMTASFIR
ncbi:MAG: hypothetical protein CM15mP74_28630 [Halieaceae bacterium]|nr:MAG: hypothetical protein CM15mP74_28630 [Halieaceae bacterium]